MPRGDEVYEDSVWASRVVSRNVGRMSIQIRMAVQIMVVEGGGKSTYKGQRCDMYYVFIPTRWDSFDVLSGLYVRCVV